MRARALTRLLRSSLSAIESRHGSLAFQQTGSACCAGLQHVLDRSAAQGSRLTTSGAVDHLHTTSSLHALQQARGFAAEGGRAAALRRVRRANERAAARPRSQQLQQQEQDELQAAASEAIEPTEGPASSLQVAKVVNHPALIIARPIEWGTVLLGYEQANRYTVYDEHGNIVALLAEEEGSLGRMLGRQLLRTRRPFTATVFTPEGQVVFRLRRPFYLINSSMSVEDGEGNVVGEVHQRWHLWKRLYDLYIDRRQFAAISGGLLAWDFELKDEAGRSLALIDRNFSGFGRELFTDAGRYVIHFGSSPAEAAQEIQRTVAAQHPDKPPPPPPPPPPSVTALARVRTDVAVIPTSTGNQLVVERPLKLDERMVALAAGISIDYDYFSRHSHGHGLLSPFIHPPIIPYPVPVGGAAGEEAGEGGAAAEGAEGAGAGAGAAAGTEAAGAGAAAAGAEAAAEGASSADTGGGGWWGGGGSSTSSGSRDQGPAPADQGLERDLGGDEFSDAEGDSEGGWFGGGDDGDDDGDGGGFFGTLRDISDFMRGE